MVSYERRILWCRLFSNPKSYKMMQLWSQGPPKYLAEISEAVNLRTSSAILYRNKLLKLGVLEITEKKLTPGSKFNTKFYSMNPNILEEFDRIIAKKYN